ncbi:MAG: 2-iminoacetate synthase ThiH [Syntrophorhabdaceae bacterium]
MNKNISGIDLAHLTFDDLRRIFASDDRGLLEEMAHAARDLTKRQFGRTISLYAPLYIANYCQNECVYCGFHASSGVIPRSKLTLEQIDRECAALAATGIRSVLILTGESRFHSSPHYIRDAAIAASRHFPYIAIEVYPLEEEEYGELYRAGVDGVTLYQETYDRARYDELHLSGPKKVYDYRVEAPDRVARAGMRHISLGVLLGLTDWHQDIMTLFKHVRTLERRYPGVEFGLAFPRIRRVADDVHNYLEVSDKDMLKIMTAARLFFPRAGISISTREMPEFRDRIIEFGVTKMSAGSSTRVGGYVDAETEYNDGQFQVFDPRSFDEVKAMLISKGFDPVVTDWRNIVNSQ